MKNILLLLLLLCVGEYFFHNYIHIKGSKADKYLPQSATARERSSICVVYGQDVSGTIEKHGVEITSSAAFIPYFNEVNRNIELNFGIIDELSTEKLITLILPAKQFNCPPLKDLTTLSATEKRREKEEYTAAYNQYTEDSIKYFTERTQHIETFSKNIDSLLDSYRSNLAEQTDLISLVDIADKVFNYSVFKSSENYLLLNTDGMDTYHRRLSKLKNKAEVVLINADRNIETSIDSIVTLRLQSTDQAFKFTLK
jgi:hypothetical protein